MKEPSPVWPDASRHVPDARFPRYRFVPGLHPHPRRDPAGSLFGAPEHAPGLPEAQWCDDRSYLLGVDLYHQGYLWESHEAWEACFHTATDPGHRDLLQGLIQLAAAVLQRHRGVANGVRILARSSVTRLRSVVERVGADERHAGLDVRAVLDEVERHFANALGDGDPLEVSGAPPRLALR